MRRQGEFSHAVELYARVFDSYWQSADVLAAVASCHYNLALCDPTSTGAHWREAVAWMAKAVALAPQDARLRAGLAECLHLGALDYEQAAREYRKAIELNPSYAPALVGASALYGTPEQVVTLDEAIAWLERATELQPNEQNWHARLGSLYREANRLEEAEREFMKALLCPRPLDVGYINEIETALGI
jgi:tetratricopeptide (TPR) repeat protein